MWTGDAEEKVLSRCRELDRVRAQVEAPVAMVDRGPGAQQYSAEEILRDGSSIRVRAIRPDDKQRLADHFNQLSAQSVYFRFFRSKKRLTEQELVQFTEIDFVRNVGLVATLGQGDGSGSSVSGVTPSFPAAP